VPRAADEVVVARAGEDEHSLGLHDGHDLVALSRARVAMVQAQDVLGLGSEARMNQPGRAAGAWKWRLAALPSRSLAQRCAALPRPPGGSDERQRPH
jgi:4-alpha-glucanotransferase